MDYYKLLGVSKNATEDEIKKAFREKAKQYHPDLNKEGQDLFKQITEAYHTLINPEKKRIYDQSLKRAKSSLLTNFEEKFSEFLGFTTKPIDGTDIHTKIYISLEEGYNGSYKDVVYTRKSECEYCKGTGTTEHSFITVCENCKGSGKKKKLGINFPCLECFGKGFKIHNPCKVCEGKGYIKEKVTKTIHVPSGIRQNQILVLKNGGNTGLNNGKNGNLYIKVKLKKHPHFKLKNNNLYMNFDIPRNKIQKGIELSFKNLKDETLHVKIPENLMQKTVLKVKNEGYIDSEGNKGDLFITINPV